MRWKEKQDRLRFLSPKTRLRVRGIVTRGFLTLRTRGRILQLDEWPDRRVPDVVAKRRFYWRTFHVEPDLPEIVRVFPRKRKWSWVLRPISSGRPLCPRSHRARLAALARDR